MTEGVRHQIEAIVPKDEASLREYRRIVGGAVETMIGRSLPKAGELALTESKREDLGPHRMRRLFVRYRPQGEELPVICLQPGTRNRHAVIWVDRLGKQGLWAESGSLRPTVRVLLDNGFAVLRADLIGQGEFTPDGRPLRKARMNTSKDAQLCESWGGMQDLRLATIPQCPFSGRMMCYLSRHLRNSARSMLTLLDSLAPVIG